MFKTNSRDPVVRASVALVALVPALIKVIYYPKNIGSDDAYIHLRVASEWVRGLGWGINPHQPVNLSTGPAFTLLLALLEQISSHPVGLMQCLSAVSTATALVLIFATALAETGSVSAAFVAQVAAAFSVNLWRWNGTVMETSFAMFIVALTLFLVRKGTQQSPTSAGLLGFIVGIGILLRPETLLLLIGVSVVMTQRSQTKARNRNIAILCLSVLVVLAPWIVFARHEAITILPTTFTAKSSRRLLFLNPGFAKEFVESLVESIFFPTLLVVILAVKARVRPRERSEEASDRSSFILPLIWTSGLAGFYYLKMPYMQSPGRYLLPLLPCEVVLLALLWKHFAKTTRPWDLRLTVVCLAFHGLFAFALNQHTVAPVLARFDTDYGATMRSAAEELVARTIDSQNKRVLIVSDIGVLSCEGDGRFEIFDAGALATPSLKGLTLREQIEKTRPSYVVESLALTPDGFGSSMPDMLHEVWNRKFRSLSVQSRTSELYTIVYKTGFN